MKQEKVFINCISSDRHIGEKIPLVFQKEDISVYFPSEPDDANSICDIVTHIESIAGENGIMVCILSQKSTADNLFISNIQYMCETTGKKLSLVIYKTEEIAKVNPVALYYPQAITVNASRKKEEESIHEVCIQAKRALGIENSRTLIPFRLSRRVVKRLVVIMATLSLAASFLVYYSPQIKTAIARFHPTPSPTPIIMNFPFSGESINQGLIVDRRSAPIFQAKNNPEVEAPFYFHPVVITKKLTFTDPIFENTLDFSNIGVERLASISEKDLSVIDQSGGVLQITTSPQGEISRQIGLPINYFFTTGEITYLGIRFSLGEYSGWSNIDHLVAGGVGFVTSNQYFPIANFCISQHTLTTVSEPGIGHYLGTDWHTLELVFKEKKSAIVYLDGKEIDTITSLPEENDLTNLYIGYPLQSTTDWMHFYVSEVIYGQNEPIQLNEQSEEATYHFVPDVIDYQNNFSDGSIEDYLTNGSEFTTIADGKLTYSISPGNGNPPMNIHMKVSPMSESNYYSMRYRIVNLEPEYWSDEGNLEIYLENPNVKYSKGVFPEVQVSRYKASYLYHLGGNDWYGITGAPENFQPNYWHTMEMLIIPPSSSDSQYQLQFWQDGHLVGEGPIQDTEQLLGPDPVFATFEIQPGIYRNKHFTSEIDEITIGRVSVPDAKE